MVDRQKGCSPQCGYGLLGLCCSACLYGPCRRSPFADEGGGKFCGEESDWIVTRNLVDRVLLESLRGMATFRSALERLSGREGRTGVPRLAEMKGLLSPFPKDGNALWDRICPERAFPLLHASDLPAGSWYAALLETAAAGTERPGEIEPQLAGALRLSAMALAAEALLDETAGAATKEGDFALPASPVPLLILVSDGGTLPDGGPEGLFEEIEAACRDKVRICTLPHISQLPALGRRIHERWGIPASMSESVAVVASSSMSHGLGALALGFSVASVPPYPIHGSPRVENYLTTKLKGSFGHAYLPAQPGIGLAEQILGELTR